MLVYSMVDDDSELFLQEMQDVAPIKVNPKVSLTADKPGLPGQQHSHYAAQHQAVKDRNHLSTNEVELVQPHDILSYQRAGVQNGVFKRLKTGRYKMEARLDLHNKTVAEARVEVFDFIEACVKYELRSLLIVHGKGHRNPQKPALLKSYLLKWLPDIDDVQAFHSAQPQHGGTGALYIMLRKGDRAKEENRERHGSRANL